MARIATGAGALLLSCLTASCAGGQDFVLEPPAPEIVRRDAARVVDPREIVALVGDAAAAGRLTAGAEAAGYALTAQDVLDGLSLRMLVFRIPEGHTGPGAIAELEALEPGSTAGVNHAYRTEPTAATARGREYAGAMMGWPAGGCPAQVPIGVLDTDLRTVAPTLRSARIVRRVFSDAGDSSHGTAVAELLAGPGRLSGAALYHAAVVGDVAGADPAAGVDTLVRAIHWLHEEGVRLVNVSLAGPYNKILDRALQAAARQGMVFVAAAGNDGQTAPPRYPAAFSHTVGVTAVDAASQVYRSAPRGGHIDVAAPGVDVFVAGAGRYLTGTSMAAPFVTAAIAADPRAARLGSAAEVRRWLAGTAMDLGEPGRDETFGAGLVQAPAACRG